ncbi:MAG: type IV secretory system conjugative DNA transfer family protein [Frankiaceae bacterium]
MVVAVVAVWTFAGYAIAYLIGRRLPAKRMPGKERPAPPPTLIEWLHAQPDIPAAVAALAGRQHGAPGGHIGWDDRGNYLGARPRGGMLVIGPPGSGKSSGVIIPSILVAPAAVVSSSIKTDTMADTAAHRALIGTCWHFDPGADQQPSPGVHQARWSPLVSVRGWDDARRIASRMADPMRHHGGGTDSGDSAHFVDRARDWLEVLLYTAHLDHRPIGQVADWAASADQDPTARTVLDEVLLTAGDRGDPGARIAQTTLEGLLGTPDRERGSVLSTLARMLRIYGSLSARQLGQDTNFDPHTFVRSTDTLYLTATPERQHEYAPLIAALLEEIRYAVYGRHRAEDEGREPRRPHTTFVLDEANNTAPIPLPAIISEAGGQSLHLVVGLQDLSRARARWGTEADGFLTLFPTKVVLPGVIEPYTLNALSDAAGEYDRRMVSYSRAEQFVPVSLGQYGSINIRHQTMNPTYSIQRQRVLHQGDIANVPDGKALLFEGARWSLVNAGLHFQHRSGVTSSPPPSTADKPPTPWRFSWTRCSTTGVGRQSDDLWLGRYGRRQP